jgi:hypothetical protein
MHAEVATRKSLVKEQLEKGIEQENTDVFSLLLRANELEDGKLKMDDSELVSCFYCGKKVFLMFLYKFQIGNIYILLFAGHGLCYMTR